MKIDVVYKLRSILRDRLRKAVKHNYKAGSAVKDLGCSVEEFKQYLESKFQPGMSWENYGEWEIDHILPLANFDLTKKEEVSLVCHYSNLQPLWYNDHVTKSRNDFRLMENIKMKTCTLILRDEDTGEILLEMSKVKAISQTFQSPDDRTKVLATLTVAGIVKDVCDETSSDAVQQVVPAI